jgi:signal transduction histidine kinase/DNA-binding response OmpR family regulator
MRPPMFLRAMAPRLTLLGTRIWLVCGSLAAAAFIATGAFVFLAAQSDAERQADEAASNVARIVERDVARNVELFDLALQTAIDGLQVAGIQDLSQQMRNLVLFNRASGIKYMSFINVLDENGDVIADPQPALHVTNWAGREYFTAHRRDASPSLYVSRPFATAQEDLASIAISRRISHADGTFAGVAVAAMRLSYVHDLFSRLALGPHGSIALWRNDGVLLMRLPFDRNDIGRALNTGATFLDVLHAGASGIVITDPVDQMRRQFAVRQIGSLPLSVSVGVASGDFGSSWQSWLVILLASGIPLLLVSVVLIIMLQYELSLRQTAERADRNKSRYLAATSHDLRTPLHSILGNAERLATNFHLDPAGARHATAIVKAGEELRGVINQTLDFLQVESRAPIPKMTSVDIENLLEDCRAVFEPGATARGLALRCALEPRTPRWFVTDHTLLRQILQNLVGNAVKFTTAGSVRVKIGGTVERLSIEVADTGRGIPEEQRHKLFVEFERLGAENTGIAGNGLGLSICRRLVTSLGGDIGHRDNPECGSVFWFTLPGGTLPDATDQQSKATAPSVGRSLHVLLVDDVAMNREYASDVLRDGGHKVTEADNGTEAVRLARANDFDVVLMDMRMEGMNGLEATKQIRKIAGPRGRVPIVAVTANASDEHITQCQTAGMGGHLAKPFKKDELLAVITRVVAEHSSMPMTEPPAFDARALAQLEDFMSKEAIEQHLHDLEHRIETVLERLGQPDACAKDGLLADMAHELAGSAGTYGFVALSAATLRFETAARTQPAQTEQVAQAADELTQVARSALAELCGLTSPEPVGSA